MKRLAVVAVLLLAACKPAATPNPPSPLDVYRACVEPAPADRSRQGRCQVKAWGGEFSDDDARWMCAEMGDLQCGPGERKA